MRYSALRPGPVSAGSCSVMRRGGMVVGCCVAVDPDHEDVCAAVEALRAAGITLDASGIAAGVEIAVVFAGRVDPVTALRVGEIAATCKRVLAILVADARTSQDGLALLDAGASDVLVWCDGAAMSVAHRLARWQAVERVLESPAVRDHLIGDGRAWRRLLRRVVEIARFTSASMLLSGESGTGKELVARLVHTLDPRPDKAELVVVDCTTIVPTLSGSEFFGHERGAFTGAAGPRDGAFALADRGTLFLDEVGELPLPLQAQLLRVIQERTYKRVGGNDWQRADFRLVCATHRDLAEAVRRGEFRHDLFHRIATWTFELPSLAERREDIPALVRHFLRVAPRSAGPLKLDGAVEQYLMRRAYPGNIRELRHTVQRLIDRSPGDGVITVGQIPEDERAGLLAAGSRWPDESFEAAVRRAVFSGIRLKDLRKTTEDLAVGIALALESGSVARASRRLGVTARALQLRQAVRREQVDGEDPTGSPDSQDSAA
jgi:transcriptional regulator with GAF, ATPase, and Fis domain